MVRIKGRVLCSQLVTQAWHSSASFGLLINSQQEEAVALPQDTDSGAPLFTGLSFILLLLTSFKSSLNIFLTFSYVTRGALLRGSPIQLLKLIF